MEFRLRERGIGNKCGKVPESVRRGEELVDREVGWMVGRKENVGDIV